MKKLFKKACTVGLYSAVQFSVFHFSILQYAQAETPYKKPPEIIEKTAISPLAPQVSLSPDRSTMLLLTARKHPSLSLLAEPYVKLAGMRINPIKNAQQRTTEVTRVELQKVGTNVQQVVDLPVGARPSSPVWSPDGKKIALYNDTENAVELWIVDVESAQAEKIDGLKINDVFGQIEWSNDSKKIYVKAIPAARGAKPEAPKVPNGPVIEETAGKVSQVMTYQDLLKNPYDEKLFEYLVQAQIVEITIANKKQRMIGESGMISSFEISPNEEYILVEKLKRPFSYRVPVDQFAQMTEVWTIDGKMLKVLNEHGVLDEIPRQGVPTGMRALEWQALKPATLVWAEALDGGDPLKKVDFRDRILTLSAPFQSEPQEVTKVKHRFSRLRWTSKPNIALVTETDRDRRWTTTTLLDFANPVKKDTLFDRSINDRYGDPGEPIMERVASGERVITIETDKTDKGETAEVLYLSGAGASEQGNRPFLDKMNIATRTKQRLWQSDTSANEMFVGFAPKDKQQKSEKNKMDRTSVFTRWESPTNPPNYAVRSLKTNTRENITFFKDNAPALQTLSRQLMKYKRADGVPLSGTLYLPPNYKKGDRLPLLVWAYPREFSDASTAGQVDGSTKTFTQVAGDSPILFALAGYAVLMNATMPVVGDPETMNNTFVEQIVSSAKAAIDHLDSLGIIDRTKCVVSGHSYGAFMTANLLAHSDLFACGIARSGAYNRSLTPFGFQSERRNYWEATDIYTKLSPFTYANKINEPLMLIHGQEDNNPGTHTMQSERLFQALKGNGGTAKLVLLPYESHGYRAEESVLHVIAEMLQWADRYTKK